MVSVEAPYTIDKSANKLQLDQFIADFDRWLFGEFRLMVARAGGGIPDAAELTLAILRWTEELAEIHARGRLAPIEPQSAGRLHWLLDCAFTQVAREYQRCGASEKQLKDTLAPLGTILAFLACRAGEASS